MLADPVSKTAKEILDSITSAESYPEIGYRFLMGIPGLAVVMSGVSSTKEVEENLMTFDKKPLDPNEMKEAIKAAKQLADEVLIPCTGCNYCENCPSGIKISGIFAIYNEAAASNFNRPWLPLSKDYRAFEKNTNDCLHCGLCESHCPQNIHIISELQKIDEKYNQLEKEGK